MSGIERIRQCYLVMAHGEPSLLHRTIDALRVEGVRFVVHIDRKSDAGPFKAALNAPDVHFVEERVKVFWAGFSMIEAELALLRTAYRMHPGAERFTLISGQCYPVASNAALLSIDPKRNIISVKPVDKSSKTYSRITRAYLPDHPVLNARGDKDLHHDHAALRRYVFGLLDALPALPEPTFDYCKGSQWWSLSRDAVRYVLDYCDANPAFIERFRYSWAADEAFFHTILGNSPLAPSCAGQLHHVPEKSVRFGTPLDESDYDAVAASGRWFTRKVDAERSAALLDRIDTLRMTKAPAAVPSSSPAAAKPVPTNQRLQRIAQIEWSDIKDGQVIICGRLSGLGSLPNRLWLKPAAPLEGGPWSAPVGGDGRFEFRWPIDAMPTLSGFRYDLYPASLEQPALKQKRGAADRLSTLRLDSRDWFFHHVQNRATHVRDRAARLRLAAEAKTRFTDDPEVQVACICIQGYDWIESGSATAATVDTMLALRPWLLDQLSRIPGIKFVRWTGSTHIMLAYLALTQRRWDDAIACFAAVVALMPRAAEWPSIEVNVMRSSFALGYLLAARGDFDQARHYWSQSIAFCQSNVALKDFSNYYKIEETHAALDVALHCDIGLAKLKHRGDSSGGGHVAALSLKASSVHGRYLGPLDALPLAI